jgi:beta-1,4-mannosyl-glycoprotein beta-1,4-N-acetylglucosaminyltransferase
MSQSKIIDSFIFYNEVDLLNYRLNILDSVVDYFVIVESTLTFTGKKKELIYNNLKSQFNKFKDKIIHIIVDDMPFEYPNINFNNKQQWENEYHQRNCISRGIDMIENKNENDFIIISDLDEIPDPNTLLKIKNNEIEINYNSLEMDFYYYNLNTKFRTTWNSAKIIKYHLFKSLKKSCNNIREDRQPDINNGGWHLSYFGDSNFIVNKLNNFSHQEYNNYNYTDINKIQDNVKNNKDLFNRPYCILIKTNISENNYLPPEYNKYLTNYFTN